MFLRMNKRLVLMAIIVIMASGCSISKLQHEGLNAADNKREGNVALFSKAEGFSGGRVGWGRLSPFAIPVAPVYIRGDESIQLMSNIKEALEVVGYTVNLQAVANEVGAVAGGSVEPKIDQALIAEAKSPVLKCIVEDISFSNYTWLAPIIPTWGGLDVTLQLEGSDGVVLWTEKFDGGGFTFNFFDGYNIASQESMSELLNRMILAFSSEKFYQALAGKVAVNETN